MKKLYTFKMVQFFLAHPVFVYILGQTGAIVGKWAQIAGKSRSFRCGNAFAALYAGQPHQDRH